jgi:tripartite ATP-independent transporter DctP family solute receptor
MKTWWHGLKSLALAAVAGAFLAGAGTSAVSAQTITIRAGLTDPLDTPYGAAMVEFKRIVEEGSAGRIKVQLFPSAQLGGVPEQLENVRTGVQEMTLISPGYASQFFQPFDALEMPYLVTDWDEAQRMLNSPAFAKLTEDAAKGIGVRIVGNFPYGFRNIANGKRAVTKLEDFKGLKLRTQSSPVHIAAFRALGASPVAIGWGETYQAVQTGVVDGLENANTVLIANRYPEIAKYVSVTRHLFGMLLVAMNQDLYNRLSPDDRALLLRAMKAGEKINIDRALEIDRNSIATLTKMGAVVNEVPPAEIARMREAVQSVYRDNAQKFEPYLTELRSAVAAK